MLIDGCFCWIDKQPTNQNFVGGIKNGDLIFLLPVTDLTGHNNVTSMDEIDTAVWLLDLQNSKILKMFSIVMKSVKLTSPNNLFPLLLSHGK